MKLSTKGRYGLRLMIDIAVRCEKGPVMLKSISARQEISEKYLWQLISPLMVAGLIVSKRGAKGGYLLARQASDIDLYEIVNVLEGDLSLVECVTESDRCKRIDKCLTNEIWTEIARKIKEVLTSYTLQDMVEKHNKKTNSLSFEI